MEPSRHQYELVSLNVTSSDLSVGDLAAGSGARPLHFDDTIRSRRIVWMTNVKTGPSTK